MFIHVSSSASCNHQNMKETHGETHEGTDSFWIFCGQTTRAQNEANFYGNHSEEYDLWVDVSGGSKELFP